MLLTCTQVLWCGTLSETTECHMSIYFIATGQKKKRKSNNTNYQKKKAEYWFQLLAGLIIGLSLID